MNSALIAIVAILGTAFLILYLINSLDKDKHWILQLIAFVFFISLLLLIPKTVIDGQEECGIVVKNETTYLNDTTYNYMAYCYDVNVTTGESFLGITYRFYYLLLGYIIVALAVVALIYMRDAAKPNRKKRK